MPSLENKTYRHCISSVECRSKVSTTKFQNQKHIGGYIDVQKNFSLQFFQEQDGKLKQGKKHWKIRTVTGCVQTSNHSLSRRKYFHLLIAHISNWIIR